MTGPRAHSVLFAGAGGAQLVGTERGEGPRPALLLHGGGQTRHAWDKTATAMAQAGWRAIAVDQRGHGDSDWRADKAYAFPDFADDALALGRAITARAGTPPVAVGASLGGIAALLALGRNQAAFRALVLVDVTPTMDPSGVDKIQGFMRAHASEGFASIAAAADAVAAYLPHRPRPTSLDGLRKNLRQHADGRFRWHWDPAFLDGPRPVATDHETVRDAMIAASKGLRVPALLVRGRSSELVTEDAAREFRELAPHAEFVDVAGARHMVAGDRNDAFSAAILDFISRV